MAGFHALTVRKVEPLTDDSAAVTFDVPSELEADYDFAAGQSLVLRRVVDGVELVWYWERADGTADSRRADESLNPASVVKVATTLWALETLGPTHRFRTTFAVRGTIDVESGVLHGDVLVFGNGDPDFHVENAQLVARRLIEAGVQLVGVNEFNQKWDTHGDLKRRYQEIVPSMDQGFAALVEDLSQRGMLDDTLVVNAGEFGRTPKMNQGGGRDHWPNVYSIALAGGGIRGGQVLGASDSKGAEPIASPVSPADVLATMWNQLGIDPATTIPDHTNRPMYVLDDREVVRELMG